ncbi:hypothetical protein GCM10023149_07790 [Mucilaginibacter gynuensis]|uniref:FAS1 domain-containing protein n=2 Tax=Mucilaginibacter gynuensis TaxID=1302236 RepID=A0ABP8FWF7_9SPHI
MVSLLAVLLLVMSACKREAIDRGEVDPNNINNVVNDNFNLSIFNTVLKVSRQDLILKEKGPFTLLAPSDAAFSGTFSNPQAVATADRNTVARIAYYHMLDGRYELNKLPFKFNQELRSRGGKLYLTRWLKGADTVITINGARLLAKNIPASNGLVQVMNRVLTPYLHEKLGNALAAESTATLFYEAMLSSGLLETINGTGPYTILAPDNGAMMAMGYTSVAQISKTDPEVLKRLVSYHIIRDRRFVYDYILGTENATVTTQNMLNGGAITIKLIADSSQPGGFGGVTVRGTDNTSDISIVKQDILTGNGVLHIIGGVLKSGI